LPDSGLLFILGRAAFFGLLTLAGTLIALRQSAKFRRNGYWWWLGGAICMALLMPFVYVAMTSYNISYTDALLLRDLHAGSWRVADAYAIVAGVATAGLIDLFIFRQSSR
jgi:hypothetical protein